MTRSQLTQLFGENVRARRLALGKTQKEVADATGLSIPRISQLESGYADFPVSKMADLARVLECTPADLIREKSFAALAEMT